MIIEEGLKDVARAVSLVFEISGVTVILAGFVWALTRALQMRRTGSQGRALYYAVRRIFGKSILLGLEVLVAADLIRTVAVDPTLRNLYVLGLLVIIRTFLSFSLDVELEGVWPWQKRRMVDAERIKGVQYQEES